MAAYVWLLQNKREGKKKFQPSTKKFTRTLIFTFSLERAQFLFIYWKKAVFVGTRTNQENSVLTLGLGVVNSVVRPGGVSPVSVISLFELIVWAISLSASY